MARRFGKKASPADRWLFGRLNRSVAPWHLHSMDSSGVLLAGAALALGINWVAFVPAYLARTERFYDITGTLTFLSVVACALVLAPQSPRGWLLAAMVTVWTVRLGTFLFHRVHQDGGDARFAEIKQSAPRFLLAWTLQGVWVFVTLLAMLLAMASPHQAPIGLADVVGATLWMVGLAIEVVADQQKRAFKRAAANAGGFIHTGLWAWSRHPNYFGEMLLWVGVTVVAATTFGGWTWLGLVSPVFVAALIGGVSGVPLLEARAEAAFGHRADYQAYKKGTPVLVPRPPRRTLDRAG